MFLIVVGAGSIGTKVVELAKRDKHNVVVIDKDAEKCRMIGSKYDVATIPGDATTKPTMEEANASAADALIATTSDDATNLMICMLARDFGIKNIASIVNSEEHLYMFENEKIRAIGGPDWEVAKHLYWAVERPDIRNIIRIGEKIEIFEVEVNPSSEAVGKKISELKLGEGALVVCIQRNSKMIIPKGDTKIEGGDKLTVLSHSDQVEKLCRLFGKA